MQYSSGFTEPDKIDMIVRFSVLFISYLTYVKGILLPLLESGGNYPQVSMAEVAKECGYRLEEHKVPTEDGYILTHFHIVGSDRETKKPVVFLMHGIHTNSDSWATHDEKSLPILLLKSGYDVWLGNSRGNKYSQSHRHLSAKDPAFWKHSWHEIGVEDLPASIDYILDRSANEELFYIGYSTGTSAFFAMLSERPEYNEKVRAMVAYAPIAFTANMKSPTFQFFSKFDRDFLEVSLKLPLMDFLTSQGPLIEFLRRSCLQEPVSETLCFPFLALTFGPRWKNESNAMIHRLIENLAASSLQQIVHFTQLYSSGKFRKFQYPSPQKNLEEYGSQQPPEYNLKNTKIPVALFTVPNDYFVSREDAKHLADTLPNVALNQQVEIEYYGFFSYLSGPEAPEVLYQPTVNLLRNITSV